jgi:serine/threonine-protein kinase
VRQDLGRYAEAAAAYARALAIARANDAGPPSASTAQTINNLATLDEERGDLAAAERGYRESLAVRLRTQPEGSVSVARARHNLARALLRAGRADEAAPLADAARAAREAALPADAPDRFVSLVLDVEIRLALGDRAGAAQAAEAVAAALPSTTARPRTIAAAHRALAALAATEGDAARRIESLAAALAVLRGALPAGHPLLALAELDLAEALGPDRAAEAARLRAGAVPLLDAALSPESPDRRRLHAAAAR